MVVGITGNVGSGKTTVVGFLEEAGWQSINVDELAQEIIHSDSQIQIQIRDCFGNEYFDKQGILKRKELGQKVFSDATLLKQLDDIVWPVLLNTLQSQIHQINKDQSHFTAVDMAVLFEAECQSLFDCILVVMASEKNRRFRLKTLRQWSLTEINQRMRSQLDDAVKIQEAHYVIWNDGSLPDLSEKTMAFIHWINQQAVMIRKES
ncbi:dephospho-CoA kinase [bacterium]